MSNKLALLEAIAEAKKHMVRLKSYDYVDLSENWRLNVFISDDGFPHAVLRETELMRSLCIDALYPDFMHMKGMTEEETRASVTLLLTDIITNWFDQIDSGNEYFVGIVDGWTMTMSKSDPTTDLVIVSAIKMRSGKSEGFSFIRFLTSE